MPYTSKIQKQGVIIVLKSLHDTIELINQKKLLHICASQDLLCQLPKGNWIGGSSEFWAMKTDELNAEDKLCVFELDFDTYAIKSYTEKTISNFTMDTYANGFSAKTQM